MASIGDMKQDLNRFCQLKGVQLQINLAGAPQGGFRCDLSVPGIPHRSSRTASNKKAAQDEASKDLHRYLVSSGLLQEALSSAQPAAKKRKTGGGGGGAAGGFGGGFAAGPVAGAKVAVPAGAVMPGAVRPGPVAVAGGGFTVGPIEPVAQGEDGEDWAEEDGAAEAQPKAGGGAAAPQPVVEDGMGNYSIATARPRLVDQLKKWRQPIDVHIESQGPPHSPSFKASMSFWCPKLNKQMNEYHIGTVKKTVQQELALKICRKLYAMGVMPKYATSAWKKSTSTDAIKETKYHEEGSFGFGIEEDTKQRLQAYLAEQGYELPEAPPGTTLVDGAENGRALAQASAARRRSGECPAQGVTALEWSAPGSPEWQPWPPPRQEVGLGTPEPALRQLTAALPVAAKYHEIVRAVAEHRVVIVQGSTGCGKTTQVPQFLLDAEDGHDKCIVVAQPRRLPAITVAQRVAAERGEPLGGTVGYAVRFDQVWPRQSNSICYMTTGFLLKRFHSRNLHGVSHIIVDEVHERDLNNDLLLGMLRTAVCAHPGLRVILMSATIDAVKFQLYMDSMLGSVAGGNTLTHTPLISVEGRVFDVETLFLEDIIEQLAWTSQGRRGEKDPSAENMLQCDPSVYSPSTVQTLASMNEQQIPLELVKDVLRHIVPEMQGRGDHGSVLIFMPTWGMMSLLQKILLTDGGDLSTTCHFVMLHSRVPKEEQMDAFRPAPEGKTKIIIATNIAESSVTIDDVSVVIDSCRVKLTHFSPTTGFSHNAVQWTGRMNLEQRKGRAGRTRPGTVFRLCTKKRFDEGLEDEVPPELTRMPLVESALLVKSLALGGIREVLANCLDAPPEASVEHAVAELHNLRALDEDENLTPLGRVIARIPVNPTVGLALLFGHWFFRLGDAMATICAAMSFDEPFPYEKTAGYLPWSIQEKFSGRHKHSDQFTLALLHQEFARIYDTQGESAAMRFCDAERLNAVTMRQVRDATEQLRGILSSAALGAMACGDPLGGDGEHVAEDEGLKAEAPRNFSAIRDWGPNDWEWGAVQLLLAVALPHLAVHQEKRHVWVSPETLGAVHKGSLNCNKGAFIFPSPIFAFLEQVKDAHWKPARCRQLTNLQPLLVLLRPFASNTIGISEEGTHAVVSGWIKLGPASATTTALLVSLRQHLEDLLADAAAQVAQGASAAEIAEAYKGLMQILRSLLVQRSLKYRELPGESAGAAGGGSWSAPRAPFGKGGKAWSAGPRPGGKGGWGSGGGKGGSFGGKGAFGGPRPAFRPFRPPGGGYGKGAKGRW